MISDENILTMAVLFLAYGLLMYLGQSNKSGPAFQMVSGFVAIAIAIELYIITADFVVVGICMVVSVATFVAAFREAT